MNNLIIAVLIIAELLLGGWCWSYSMYRNAVDENASLFTLRQDQEAAVLLQEFRRSSLGTLYRQVPFLSRLLERIIYAEATVKMRLGDIQAAQELYQKVISSEDAEIRHGATYNLALLHIRKGDFVSARVELGNSLRVMPHDLDSKYNLEILIRKELERKKKEPEEGNMPLPQSMMKKESEHFPEDLWRFETPEEGEGGESPVRRRYL